jgi:thiol:disulfide interchange protein DsbA
MKKLLSLLVLFVFFSPLAMAEFEEGHEYAPIPGAAPLPKDAPIEVVEFFWYACPHCYHFEPHINGWLKNKPEAVTFTRIPATFNKLAKFHAEVFYALDLMGEADRTIPAFFEEIHEKKNKLATPEAVDAFLTAQGIELETFHKAIKSFAVQTRVRQAESMFRKYELTGVPSIVVSGQYKSANVKNYDELVQVIDHMISVVGEDQKAAD